LEKKEMMNSFDSNIIPIIESFTDRAYIKDMDMMRPDKLLDDVVVRNKIDDYKLSRDLRIRDELIFAFGNFVVAVAKQYQGNGLPICDLIGEGIIGLINAIEGYDSTNPTKFITYAGVIISRQIREALDQTTLPIRVPKNIRNTMHKVKKKVMDCQLSGIEPETLADEFDEKENVFLEFPFKFQKVRIDTDGTDESPSQPSSFSSPNIMHMDFVQVSDNQPDKDLIEFDLNSELHKVMKNKLTKIERKVLRLYYGLNRKYPMNSVKEIGRILHISGERARQLRDAALEKLRTSEIKNIFVDYI
jgi:RNA polymerase primary sigma factor